MTHPFPRFVTKSQRARFHASSRLAESGCIEWTGLRIHAYGYISLDGRKVGAHRLAWVLQHNEPIPVDMEIDHICRNTICVNPAHMELVTKQENLRRRWESA